MKKYDGVVDQTPERNEEFKPLKDIATRIKERNEKLEQVRSNWTSIWKECSKYALPRIEEGVGINEIITEGKEHSDLYDSTAQILAEKLANSMFTFLTPSSTKWFDWSTGDDDLDNIEEVNSYLREVAIVLQRGLLKSNFYPQAHEAFLDSVVLGTATLFAEATGDKKDPVTFYATPIYHSCISANYVGKVDTLYRTYMLSGEQIRERFPDHKLDEDKKYKIIHAIEPAANFYGENKPPLGVKKFISYLIVEDENLLLSDIKSGFNSFPAGVGMFYKSSEDSYGRSPTMRCLADIRSLNLLRKSYLTGTQLASAPPLQVKHNSIVGNRVMFKPFGLTYIKGDSEIRPLITGARPDIGESTIARLQEGVGLAFYQDSLSMTRKTHQIEAQISSFNDEQIRSLSAVFVRMTSMLETVLNRMFEIYESKGLIPTAPPVLRKRPELVIQYRSQLARSQRQGDVQNIMTAVQMIGQIAQIDQSALVALDGQETIKLILQALDVDRKVIRSEQEIKEIQDAQNQKNEQIENEQRMKTNSETAKNLSQ